MHVHVDIGAHRAVGAGEGAVHVWHARGPETGGADSPGHARHRGHGHLVAGHHRAERSARIHGAKSSVQAGVPIASVAVLQAHHVLGFHHTVHAAQGLTGFAVPHQNRHGHSSRRGQGVQFESFLLSCPFKLVPVVLEPNFDLGWSESDNTGQVFSLWRWEVPLLSKPPLEFIGLSLGEKHSTFLFLWWIVSISIRGAIFLVLVAVFVFFFLNPWFFADVGHVLGLDGRLAVGVGVETGLVLGGG